MSQVCLCKYLCVTYGEVHFKCDEKAINEDEEPEVTDEKKLLLNTAKLIQPSSNTVYSFCTASGLCIQLEARTKTLLLPDAPKVIKAVKTPHATRSFTKMAKLKKKKMVTNINRKISKYIDFFFPLNLLFGPQLVKHLLDLQSPVLLQRVEGFQRHLKHGRLLDG